MKKILTICLLLNCFNNTLAKTIHSSSHHATTHRVSTIKSYSSSKITNVRPKTSFTHKSAIKQTISTKPSYTTTSKISNTYNSKKTEPVQSNNNVSSYSKIKSNTNIKNDFNDSFDNNHYKNSGLNFVDYMVLNSIFNSDKHKEKKYVELEENEISNDELIEMLYIAIKKEKEKFTPDQNKIKKYESIIKKLKKK